MKTNIIISVVAALIASGCQHTDKSGPIVVYPPSQSLADRQSVAAQTCEAQYQRDRQNYLSAVQTVIASGRALPNASNAPLDRFRAEVNAAYNTVVMRCKTHMHCLETHNYNEAACYMSTTDRKDAERRFADLSKDLRRIEREYAYKKPKGKYKKKKKCCGGDVNVTVKQTQNNDQRQTNDNRNGDVVEDQDVLILCGDAKNLLDRRCRPRCEDCGE